MAVARYVAASCAGTSGTVVVVAGDEMKLLVLLLAEGLPGSEPSGFGEVS